MSGSLPALLMQPLLDRIRRSASADIIVNEVRLAGRQFILVGENHHSTVSSDALLQTVASAHANGEIILYVELEGDADRHEADSRLARASGAQDPGPLNNNSNSLLPRLRSLKSARFFNSRPEEITGGMLLEPDSLSQMLFVSSKCLDLRRGQILGSFQKATDICMDIAGSALYVAEGMVERGVIDERLKSVVFQQLVRVTTPLVELTKDRLAAPLRGRLTEATFLSRSYADAIDNVVFSPHVVSDAYFATQLVRDKELSKPVVVVGGKSHADTIAEDLRALL